MKKIIVFLLVMILSVSAFSQVMKVGILEVIDKDGSISYAHKLVIRETFAKSIANLSGFETLNIATADAVLREQNILSGSAIITKENIKTIGLTLGVDYFIVIEGVKVDEANLFLTAKLFDVIMEDTKCTDNILTSTNAMDILNGCETLSRKLFGEPTHVIVNTQEVSAKREVTAMITPQAIGTLKVFEDGTRGIVFYATNDGHGLVVSLEEEEKEWADSDWDISLIPNEEDENTSLISGVDNTTAIIRQLGEDAPAALWCRSLGEEWYMPTLGEMIYLIKIANLEEGDDGPISEALSKHGGDELEGWYWSCSEEDDENAWNIKDSGNIGTEEKDKELNVRAVRAF